MANSKYINRKTNIQLIIRKNEIELVGLLCLMIFSFISTVTLVVSLIILLVLLTQKEIGAVKIINIITFRSIINPGVAISISNSQNLKWIILFGCSFYLMFAYFKLGNNELKKIKSILFLVILFGFYNIFVAFKFSSLPIVATTKLLSYIVIFIGTMIGIGYTYRKFDWIKWLLQLFSILIIVSFFMIRLPVSYLRNGYSFQGITNHPNMFGMVPPIFLALILSYKQLNKNFNKIYIFFMIPITMYMVILSKSRTSFISCIILLSVYIAFLNIEIVHKILINIMLFISIITIAVTNNRILKGIFDFLYKGQNQGGILDSRQEQINIYLSNIVRSPWFGNGFAVPVLPFKSFVFSSEYVVEPGNLVLAVLSYCGMFGFLIFLTYIINIFFVNKKNFRYVCFLPLSAILISMGEMVFFSSNNNGIWCYMMMSIYIFTNRPNNGLGSDNSV